MVTTLKPTTHTSTIRPDLRPKGNLPEPAVVLAFMGQKSKLNAQKKEIADQIKKLNQQATNAGIVIEELDQSMKYRDMDPQTLVEKFARLKHYTMAAEVPIGFQFSLFTQAPAAETTASDLLEQAYREGFVKGVMGDNPDYQKFHENTDLGQKHTEGWMDGQKRAGEIFIEANAKMKEADAAKGKTKEQKAADKKAAAEKAAAEKKEKADKAMADKRAKADAKRSEKEIAAVQKKAAKEAEAQKKAARDAGKVVPIGKKKPGASSRKH